MYIKTLKFYMDESQIEVVSYNVVESDPFNGSTIINFQLKAKKEHYFCEKRIELPCGGRKFAKAIEKELKEIFVK